jgi:hypothetical protein
MNRTVSSMLSLLAGACCCAAPAFGQATRTWVSGVGDDANPCSRTAPCKTFPGAISKTAAGGEIDALDPGGFGAVTITKSITLDGGGGQVASILVSGTNAIVVNAGLNDQVIVRNLSLNGLGGVNGGLSGIKFLQGAQLIVDNVSFTGFTQNGIEMAGAAGAVNTTGLVVRNSTFSGGAAGVKLTSGGVNASLYNVSIRGATNGVDVVSGTVDIRNAVFARNSGFGVLAEGGTIDVSDSLFHGNGTAVQSQTGSTIRIANSDFYNNQAGFGCGGGTLASAGNNRKGGNTGGGGSVCAPNATITIQ